MGASNMAPIFNLLSHFFDPQFPVLPSKVVSHVSCLENIWTYNTIKIRNRNILICDVSVTILRVLPSSIQRHTCNFCYSSSFLEIAGTDDVNYSNLTVQLLKKQYKKLVLYGYCKCINFINSLLGQRSCDLTPKALTFACWHASYCVR